MGLTPSLSDDCDKTLINKSNKLIKGEQYSTNFEPKIQVAETSKSNDFKILSKKKVHVDMKIL